MTPWSPARRPKSITREVTASVDVLRGAVVEYQTSVGTVGLGRLRAVHGVTGFGAPHRRRQGLAREHRRGEPRADGPDPGRVAAAQFGDQHAARDAVGAQA